MPIFVWHIMGITFAPVDFWEMLFCIGVLLMVIASIGKFILFILDLRSQI